MIDKIKKMLNDNIVDVNDNKKDFDILYISDFRELKYRSYNKVCIVLIKSKNSNFVKSLTIWYSDSDDELYSMDSYKYDWDELDDYKKKLKISINRSKQYIQDDINYEVKNVYTTFIDMWDEVLNKII